MIVDSSAVIAVVRNEPERDAFVTALRRERSSAISAATYLESGIVVDAAHDATSSSALDTFLRAFDIEIVPVTADQAHIARAAYRDFGKGSGHPAQLNFGDCFAYALAIDADEPLLFKGDDFGHTDVRRAVR